MTGTERSRRLRYVTVDIVPLRSLVLALFLVSGILCGYGYAGRCIDGTGEELRRYFDAYLAASARDALTAETVIRTLVCFLRTPLLVFLLGFASVGVLGVPLLVFAQGFLLSFSLCCFAGAMGREDFALLCALFAIRLLFVMPCTFLLGVASLEKSRALALFSFGGGRRVRPVSYESAYWYRFAVCCVFLLIGCVLELWLVPLLLAA